jgi:hypothetical protein
LTGVRHYLTDTQVNALRLLVEAYETYEVVQVGRATRWGEDGATITRATANRLVRQRLARYSRPSGRYVLVTEHGRTLPFLFGLGA